MPTTIHLDQITDAILHPDLASDSTLHVVSVVSNPVPYHSRYRIFREWQKHMLATANVKLYVVELAFGDRRFEVTEEENPTHLQLRTKQVLWFKENLINLGVRYLLPHDWKYVAWVDSDLWFKNQHWALDTIHALQHYPAIQPWSEIADLGPSGNVMSVYSSFASVTNPGNRVVHTDAQYPCGKVGAAWAFTREFWENTGGLIDTTVISQSDTHCAWAMVGNVEQSIPVGVSESYRQICRDWQHKAMQMTNGYLDYVPGAIEHHFHGPRSTRFYERCWDMLITHKFDPVLDLRRDKRGLLVLWNKPDLHENLRQYLIARNEDSVEETDYEEIKTTVGNDDEELAKTAWSQARTHFTLKNWQACIDAYQFGLGFIAERENPSQSTSLETARESTKILAAASYSSLGRNREAIALLDEAMEAFPGNETLKALRLKILEGLDAESSRSRIENENV